MTWQRTDDSQKINRIIHHLVSGDAEISVKIDGESSPFASKLLTFNPRTAASGYGRRPYLFVQTLMPRTGNTLARSSSEINLQFSIRGTRYRCKAKYVGTRSMYSRFGLLLTFPEYIEFKEEHVEGRLNDTQDGSLKVELKPGKKSENEKRYHLRVDHLSEFGLGLIITKEDSDLLKIVRKGDMLEEITFIASSAMVRTRGIVERISRIESGEHKNCSLLRIEFPEAGAS